MPIIKKINIVDFKEVSFLNQSGLQEIITPTGTTDVFGNPIIGASLIIDATPTFGTSDFNGVIRTHVLLARMEVYTVDTGLMSFNQFSQLTPQQAQIAFGGTALREDIGWVKLGETLPSYYYEDCPGVFNGLRVPGRLPVSTPFFSMGSLNIPTLNRGIIEIVNGEGDGLNALVPVGIYNIGNINFLLSFGPDPLAFPAMAPIQNIQDYLRLIINQTGTSLIPGPGGFQNSVTVTAELKSVELQQSNRDVIVNPSNPRYQANDSDTTESGYVYDDGAKLRWSEPWLIIPESFSAGLLGPNPNIGSLGTWNSENGGRNQGSCIPFPNIQEPDRPVGPDGGGPDVGPGDGQDGGTPDLSEEEIDRQIFDSLCPEPYPLNAEPYDIVTSEEISSTSLIVTFNTNQIQDTIELLRSEYQLQEKLYDYRDPREPFLESYTGKNGLLYVKRNRKRCTNDIYPAFRDKDGDVQEVIGPAMSNYFKNVRKSLSSLYGIEGEILKSIGTGSDGYGYFSDGNSYIELLGETVLGCGDQISFGLDIPEIRAESILNIEDKYFNKVTSANLKSSNSKQSITLHMMDLLYGMMSGDRYVSIEDGERLALINLGRKNPYSTLNEALEDQGLNKMTGVWENVMYPIYDKLLGNVPKSKYDVFSSETILGKSTRNEFRIIDIAISIEDTSSLNNPLNLPTQTPIKNWDWLFSKGLGAFTLNYTYEAGPNGIADTSNSKSSFSATIDYFALIQFGIGLISFIDDLLASDPEEIPWRRNYIEVVDDRIKITREYSDGEKYETFIIEEEERFRQNRRRIHKKGNVILQSRSGLYNISTLPCPIIFLGYSDNYYEIDPNDRITNIENLSKKEIIEDIKVKKKIGIQEPSSNSNNDFSLNVNQPQQVGPIFRSINNQLLSSNTNSSNLNKPEYDTIPTIKPRIKKYGRNPLLDVFYLNVVNPYVQANDSLPPTQTNRYSIQKRWSNPNRLPFRSNRSEKNWHLWPELEYAEFPSIFPPHWQYIDQTNWNKKVKTTILPLEQRWSMQVDYENRESDKSYIVLKDKTPILDLYFSLMEMHVNGISWKEILQYADTALSCVKNNNYLNWTSEQKIEMDIDKLEKLLEIVKSRIERHKSGSNLELYLSSYDYGNVKVTQKNNISGQVLIKNNTSSDFIITNVYLEDIYDESDNIVTDLYDRNPSQYFEIKQFPNVVPKSGNYLDFSEITFEFNPSESQPNFSYTVNLIVEGDINGQQITLKSEILVNTVSETDVRYYNDSFFDLIETPSLIDFGVVESNVSNEKILSWNSIGLSLNADTNVKQLVISNQSEYDRIKLDSIHMYDFVVTDVDNKVDLEELPQSFYVMNTRQILVITNITGKNESSVYRFGSNDIIQPLQSKVVHLGLLPTKSNRTYRTKLALNYTVLPRVQNSKFGLVKKTKIVDLNGVSF